MVKNKSGIIAIVGGDLRERTIAACAAERFDEVRVLGVPNPEVPIPGVVICKSAVEVACGVNVLLLPLPGMEGLTVFAPQASAPISIDRSVLDALAPGARIFCGHASPEFAALVHQLGLRVSEYEADETGRIARAPAIAEGTIARIVQETDRTIRESRVAILGYGAVGSHVAPALHGLGADITVFARRAAQRLAAETADLAVMPLDGLEMALDGFDTLISTIPAMVLPDSILGRIPASCVIFDLTSPPGSVDRVAAARRGIKVVWARGLGATSPVTVGRTQWALIESQLQG